MNDFDFRSEVEKNILKMYEEGEIDKKTADKMYKDMMKVFDSPNE